MKLHARKILGALIITLFSGLASAQLQPISVDQSVEAREALSMAHTYQADVHTGDNTPSPGYLELEARFAEGTLPSVRGLHGWYVGLSGYRKNVADQYIWNSALFVISDVDGVGPDVKNVDKFFSAISIGSSYDTLTPQVERELSKFIQTFKADITAMTIQNNSLTVRYLPLSHDGYRTDYFLRQSDRLLIMKTVSSKRNSEDIVSYAYYYRKLK